MDTQRWRGSPVNQDTLRWVGSAAEMLGQFLTYTGHQLRFSETTINDLQFIGAGMRAYSRHLCGINPIAGETQE